ncbi:hypothetical protein MHYP_G00347380 [Metynnis hypsauchen]
MISLLSTCPNKSLPTCRSGAGRMFVYTKPPAQSEHGTNKAHEMQDASEAFREHRESPPWKYMLVSLKVCERGELQLHKPSAARSGPRPRRPVSRPAVTYGQISWLRQIHLAVGGAGIGERRSDSWVMKTRRGRIEESVSPITAGKRGHGSSEM